MKLNRISGKERGWMGGRHKEYNTKRYLSVFNYPLLTSIYRATANDIYVWYKCHIEKRATDLKRR